MKLFQFTKSELRKKLLSFYFSNPGGEYYLREIANILNVDAGNLSKELNGLEKEGLFLSRLRGKMKFYALNKTHPFFEELKSIVNKTIGIEGLLKTVFQKHQKVKIAFIYGSMAIGKEKANSDIDIFIIGKPDENTLNREISAIEKQVGREINYIFWPESEVIKKMKEKNSFLEEIFKKKKIFLKGSDNELRNLYRTR